MNESFMYMYMYLHLKDGVLTFSSGIMHEFKVLLKFLCHDEDDMLTSVTLLQNFIQWSSIFSEELFFTGKKINLKFKYGI